MRNVIFKSLLMCGLFCIISSFSLASDCMTTDDSDLWYLPPPPPPDVVAAIDRLVDEGILTESQAALLKNPQQYCETTGMSTQELLSALQKFMMWLAKYILDALRPTGPEIDMQKILDYLTSQADAFGYGEGRIPGTADLLPANEQ
jgi:hypothetical protein